MSLISVHDGSIEKPDNNVRFVCVSDTHCRHNFVLPEGDVLLHGGDFSNHGSP